MSSRSMVLKDWSVSDCGITIGKVYELITKSDLNGKDYEMFYDDERCPRQARYGTWEPDPAEYIAETFAPLPVTNDAGEVSQDVNATLAQRGGRYGKFHDHAFISQGLLEMALNHADTVGVELDHVHKEALGMIFHKIGRIVNGDPNYFDSWKDIAGYATLAEKWVTDGETV